MYNLVYFLGILDGVDIHTTVSHLKLITELGTRIYILTI